MKEKRKKSKWRYFWFGLLILLILAGATTAWAIHQKQEMLQTLNYVDQYTQEELKQKHKDLNTHVHDVVSTLPEANMDILNERDLRKLAGGDLTPEQTADIFKEARKRAGMPEKSDSPVPSAVPSEAPVNTSIGNNFLTEITAENPAPSAAPSGGTTLAEQPKPSYRDVDTLIEAFYVLKAKYVTNLDGILRQCKTEWRSKPKSERTFSARLVMAEKCMQLGSALEVECDAEMAALIGELRLALSESGQSTAIISEIQGIYEEEKRIKKAYLIDRYYPK